MKLIMAIIKPFKLDDVREALTPLGVKGFVHAGIDVLETLTQWQDRLGMAS